jgi:hypothetical protein
MKKKPLPRKNQGVLQGSIYLAALRILFIVLGLGFKG